MGGPAPSHGLHQGIVADSSRGATLEEWPLLIVPAASLPGWSRICSSQKCLLSISARSLSSSRGRSEDSGFRNQMLEQPAEIASSMMAHALRGTWPGRGFRQLLAGSLPVAGRRLAAPRRAQILPRAERSESRTDPSPPARGVPVDSFRRSAGKRLRSSQAGQLFWWHQTLGFGPGFQQIKPSPKAFPPRGPSATSLDHTRSSVVAFRFPVRCRLRADGRDL